MIVSVSVQSDDQGQLKSRTRFGAVDVAFLLSLALFVALTPIIRIGSGVIFLGFFLIVIAYVLITRSLVFNPALAGLTALGAIYIVLSYLSVLPTAWTRFHRDEIIPQQSSYILALYPTYLAGRRFWSYVLQLKRPGLVLLALAAFGSMAGRLVSYAYYGWHPSLLLPIGANNSEIFSYVLLFASLYLTPSRRVQMIAMLAAVALFMVSPFMQVKMIFALAVAVAVFPWPRLVALSTLGAFLLIWAYGLLNTSAVWAIDTNSGVRLLFARDAIEALGQTQGIGVGYGTEAIKNIYPRFQHIHADWVSKFQTFISIGHHNSFIGIAFRLGVIGFFLSVWAFIVRPLPRPTLGKNESRFAIMAYTLMFVTMFVNVAIESPIYMTSMALILALLDKYNLHTDSEDVRRRPHWRAQTQALTRGDLL